MVKKSANGNKKQYTTMTFEVPTVLKNSFKAKASEEGKRIRDVLCELMEKYVKGQIKG